MKNIFRKKIIILVIILLSFNCYTAVVSDNDGTAFVTKAEFEALKEDFDTQIASYNKSLDSKIDGAIASYLAGFKIGSKIEIDSTLNKVNTASAYSRGWFPMCKTYSFKSTNKPVNGQVAFQELLCLGIGGSYSGRRSNQFYSANIDSTSGTIRDNIVYVDSPSTKTDGKYYCIEESSDKSYSIYQGDYLSASYKEALVGLRFGYSNNHVPNSTNHTWTIPELKNDSGGWAPISVPVSISYPLYWSYDGSTTWSISVPSYWIPSYQITTTNEIWPIMGTCPTTNDTICLYLDKFSESEISTTKLSMGVGFKAAVHSWYDATLLYYEAQRGTEPITLNWYYNYHPLETLRISDLAVKEVSSIMSNKKYEYYCGLPICKIDSNGTLTMELKFHSESGNKIYWAIRDTTFDNDSTYTNSSSLNIRLEDDSAITSQEVNNDTSLKIKCDVKKDTSLWIKAYDVNDATKYVGVETISLVEEVD